MIDEQVWYFLAALAPSVILHEVAHGAVAYRLGDDTAKRAGRLTLNPIAHVDPFGTIILPLLMALSTFGVFGYAKPVPVNPRQLRNPRQHSLYVALAGPVTNIALAVGAAVVFRALFGAGSAASVIPTFLVFLVFVNLTLAAFNLLPVPPLDGSALVERVLPHRWWPRYLRIRQWSMGILLLLVLAVPGALTWLFDLTGGLAADLLGR